MIILYILAIIILLITLFLILPMYINIEYKREGENDYLSLIISPFGGIIKLKIKVPFIDFGIDDNQINLKVNEKIGDNIDLKQKMQYDQFKSSFSKLMDAYSKYKKGILYFKRKIQIKKFDWNTKIGVGDAALSAILVGSLWAVKGSLVSFLSSQMKLSEYSFNIVPNFNQIELSVNMSCIIAFKPGHAIIGAIKMLFYKLKEVMKNV